FKKGEKYRYVLWARTHIDKSEKAEAIYSFPSSIGIDSVNRYEWNYSVDPEAKSSISTKDIALTGTRSFFTDGEVANAVDHSLVSDAGSNWTITLPGKSTIFDSSASHASYGEITSYEWTQKSGPAEAVIEDPNKVETKVSDLKEGTYVFTLMVRDDGGKTATDEVTVKVKVAERSEERRVGK